MRHGKRWMVAILLAAGLGVTACTTASLETAGGGQSEDAKVDSVDGTGLKRVTLTSRAAERLAIRTVPVRQSPVTPPDGGKAVPRKVLPYAAVLYDVHGVTWVFAMLQPLSYERQRVTVDYVEGDLAVLAHGPPPGTQVVTEGATELYGTELGVGTEE